ncbi:MAG: formate dehydrogenase accessory sulfurtransferase FdhD, partial [Akkermansiaceae bacterium]
MSDASREFEVIRHGEVCLDVVAREEPLQITIDGTPVAVVMRTPATDDLLVRGFLLTEGLLGSLEEIARIDLETKQNHALVFLNDDVVLDHGKLSRNLFSASSCGICGKASIDSIKQHYPPVQGGFAVEKDVLLGVPDAMRDVQKVFASTGGLHAAALVTTAGEVLCLHEDVGRHNAIDKVIGWGAAENVDFSNIFLQVSG